MKELTQILAALENQPPATLKKWALATLVTVEGSSYRRPGARLLWRGENLPPIGGISGGCLEDDLKIHCATVAKTRAPTTITYDTTTENDLLWGVGTGCHGIVRVLIEPAQKPAQMLDVVKSAWARRKPAMVANLFRFHRENEREHTGDSLNFGMQLAMSGDYSGQALKGEPGEYAEHKILFDRAAGEYLRNRKSEARIFPELPGTPEVFFEFLPPPPALVIHGAGDDAQPLSRMAAELGWQVHITDPRPAYATPERFPDATTITVGLGAAVSAKPPYPIDEHTLAVVMTHHYIHDKPALRDLLPRNLAYLGLLGSKSRAEKILSDLERDGLQITPGMRARLHAPVGLDLGATTPETIALSILAEMQSALARRDPKPLRDRAKAIHDA